jgi:transposase-like protein
MPDEQCNATKNDGEPCEYTAKYDDGKCGIHSDHNENTPAGGRPSTLAEHEQDILAGARQGMTLEGCARLAGVDESTLHRWKAQHDEFRKSLKRARAHGELQHLQSVNDAGSRFVLERSFGYVKTEKREHEHSGEDGGPIMVIERDDDA